MSWAQKVIEEENRRAGRSLPQWRYYLVVVLVVAGMNATHVLSTGFWYLIPYFVVGIGVTVLLVPYKKKGIS